MTAVIASPPLATLDDLYAVPGKAELINGRIVHLMATGHRPNLIAGRIFRSLADYTDTVRVGVAYTDNMGFAVDHLLLPSGRQSFSPDTSYYTGTLPADEMRFVEAAPDFAAEVRSENDYGPAAEVELADKRADYFAAGTQVVWDVDPRAEVVRVYRATRPLVPDTYARGQIAEAEPAVPRWRVPMDWLMG